MRVLFAFLWLAAAGSALPSCQSGTSTAGGATADTLAPLYPFPQYLADQIRYVDSMPLGIEKVTKLNGRTTDSGYIDKAVFKAAVAPFAAIDPNLASLRPSYTENSFNDLTLGTITFSISCTDSTAVLQKADVLLHADTKKVKYVLLEMTEANEDSVLYRRINWVHNMRCQVAETIQKKDSTYDRITEYIWDKPMN
ncbi:MAG: hypothetical protein MUF62_10880 [Chitinophagaceae bacterium]|jgi:hypothetical protein|nr:hypothetical protein [Chitinophagaceae bacterium]